MKSINRHAPSGEKCFSTKEGYSASTIGVRQSVTTAIAAKALNRSPQTLRKWACLENGPIRPVRVHGRLAWPLDEIAALLDGDNRQSNLVSAVEGGR